MMRQARRSPGYRLLAEACPDAIWITRDDRIVFANRACMRLFGATSPDQLLGRSPLELIHPDDRIAARERIQGLRAGAPSASLISERVIRLDGAIRHVEVAAAPFVDQGAQAIQVVLRDVTERKQAEGALAEKHGHLYKTERAARLEAQRSQRQVQAMLDAAPDALVMVNDEGWITLVNSQTARLFGYAAEELLGQPVEVLIPERFRGRHPAHRARYVAAPRVRPMGEGVVLYGRRRDGSEFPVEISLSPLRTEHGTVVISAIRDVSERRRAEAEIERMKQDLTNMVVHDLKNPLNGVAMMVQLALRKGGTGLPATQRNYLLQIDRSCREMMRLVLNLLEVSKIEEGKMPVMREPVMLAAVVEEVVEEYGAVADQCGRRLVVTVGRDLPDALGDRALMKRVLVNLVVNALRHSGSHEVRLDAARGPGSAEVTISVLDYGHGIPEEEQGHVFEKFRTVRGDPSADTGLGLPFCKLAVERMEGRIALTSTPGEMTAFAITLPARSEPG